jgi:hypothetical protein
MGQERRRRLNRYAPRQTDMVKGKGRPKGGPCLSGASGTCHLWMTIEPPPSVVAGVASSAAPDWLS